MPKCCHILLYKATMGTSIFSFIQPCLSTKGDNQALLVRHSCTKIQSIFVLDASVLLKIIRAACHPFWRTQKNLRALRRLLYSSQDVRYASTFVQSRVMMAAT